MRVYFIGLTKPVSGLFGVFSLSLEYYKKIKMRLPKKNCVSNLLFTSCMSSCKMHEELQGIGYTIDRI